jgi:hypothetical protein
MSLPRPNEPYHFQANLIWWDSPFKDLFSGIFSYKNVCKWWVWGGYLFNEIQLSDAVDGSFLFCGFLGANWTIFPLCLLDFLFPYSGQAIIRLLRLNF